MQILCSSVNCNLRSGTNMYMFFLIKKGFPVIYHKPSKCVLIPVTIIYSVKRFVCFYVPVYINTFLLYKCIFIAARIQTTRKEVWYPHAISTYSPWNKVIKKPTASNMYAGSRKITNAYKRISFSGTSIKPMRFGYYHVALIIPNNSWFSGSQQICWHHCKCFRIAIP